MPRNDAPKRLQAEVDRFLWVFSDLQEPLIELGDLEDGRRAHDQRTKGPEAIT